MRIGTFLGGDPGANLDGLIAEASAASEAGLASVWVSQIFGLEALTALAVVGRAVPRVELGTAVIPTYPRHPMVMADQALTTQAAVGGRLTLGIGLSHQLVIEGMFGYSFDRPARHMREYLSILVPLVREGSTTFQGETLSWTGALSVPGSSPFPILVAALAPRMLSLAGELADGTVTWMTGTATVGSHIVPSIRAAAKSAGRPAPRVVVGRPVCVTDQPERAREQAATTFAIYGQLPSYRAMLDREGAEGPADIAIVGDEEAVEAQVRALKETGADDLMAAPFGGREDRTRTLSLLGALATA